MTESAYPYAGIGQSCKYNAAQGVFNTVGYVSVAKSHDSIINAVAQ